MNDSYKGKNPTFGKSKSKGYNKGKGKSYGGKSYTASPTARRATASRSPRDEKAMCPLAPSKDEKVSGWKRSPKATMTTIYGGAYLMSNNTSPESSLLSEVASSFHLGEELDSCCVFHQ